MHASAFLLAPLALASFALASSSSYGNTPQVTIKLASTSSYSSSNNVQVLGDGGVNAAGCFNIQDDADVMKQAGVISAQVNEANIAIFFYTEENCVRATRIFKNTVQDFAFSSNPLLARSVRIIDAEKMKANAQSAGGAEEYRQVKGINAFNAWMQRHSAPSGN
ncbi:hypothetical protein HKX48_000682 [Thoreauomyces humboldtii]|nr:hypothetical protein HKX48_000682 [Thoreauomyces humboldtii]